MSNENELTETPITGMAVFKQNQTVAPVAADEDFDKMSSSGGLPRMTLMTSNSEEVKSGDFPTNTYALRVGEVLQNLGKNVDAVVVAYRLTALHTTDDGFCSSHDFKSDLFQEIINIADTQGFGSGAIYGQEFLVWIPSHKVFATFMCGSKTARNMAAGIKSLVGEVAVFGSKKFENKKFQWYGPTCSASNAVLTEIPTAEDCAAVTEAFVNAVGVEKELAPEAGAQATDDR